MTVSYHLPRPPGDDADLTSARLWAAGAVGVWVQPDTVVGYFPAETDAVPDGGTWADEDDDHDWHAAWRETIEPITAGVFEVVPTWLADEWAGDPDRTRIVLDPGVAFGSGHHDTTAGCLEALGELPLDDQWVLDVGTGTGVLAIAAALQGAQVVGVDLEEQAIEAARRNVADNDVEVDLRVGSLGAVDGAFEVVLANLLTQTLIDLAELLVSRMCPGAHLVASGVGWERRQLVADALAAAGLEVTDVRQRGEWAILLATRPDPWAQHTDRDGPRRSRRPARG